MPGEPAIESSPPLVRVRPPAEIETRRRRHQGREPERTHAAIGVGDIDVDTVENQRIELVDGRRRIRTCLEDSFEPRLRARGRRLLTGPGEDGEPCGDENGGKK